MAPSYLPAGIHLYGRHNAYFKSLQSPAQTPFTVLWILLDLHVYIVLLNIGVKTMCCWWGTQFCMAWLSTSTAWPQTLQLLWTLSSNVFYYCTEAPSWMVDLTTVTSGLCHTTMHTPGFYSRHKGSDIGAPIACTGLLCTYVAMYTSYHCTTYVDLKM